MYLLTKWEGQMEKYLARGHGVRTERRSYDKLYYYMTRTALRALSLQNHR